MRGSHASPLFVRPKNNIIHYFASPRAISFTIVDRSPPPKYTSNTRQRQNQDASLMMRNGVDVGRARRRCGRVVPRDHFGPPAPPRKAAILRESSRSVAPRLRPAGQAAENVLFVERCEGVRLARDLSRSWGDLDIMCVCAVHSDGPSAGCNGSELPGSIR